MPKRQGALIMMAIVFGTSICLSASAEEKIRRDVLVSVNGSIAAQAVSALMTQRIVPAAKKEFPYPWGSPPRMQSIRIGS